MYKYIYINASLSLYLSPSLSLSLSIYIYICILYIYISLSLSLSLCLRLSLSPAWTWNSWSRLKWWDHLSWNCMAVTRTRWLKVECKPLPPKHGRTVIEKNSGTNPANQFSSRFAKMGCFSESGVFFIGKKPRRIHKNRWFSRSWRFSWIAHVCRKNTPQVQKTPFLRETARKSGAKNRGFLEGRFCKMYASLGCGALSAKCTVGANILWYYLFPWLWHWTLQKPPLLKPPFLIPE